MSPEVVAERAVTYVSDVPLHARPAAVFMDRVKRFKARVTVAVEGGDKPPADARSLMRLMALSITKGTRVVIRAVGEDAETAVAALTGLIERDFRDP